MSLRWATVLAFAGICGGLFLTLLSVLYTVKPLVVDAEIMYFGFPFTWLEAGRSTWIPKPPQSWQYNFLWYGFVADFILYGLLSTAITYGYFTSRPRRQA